MAESDSFHRGYRMNVRLPTTAASPTEAARSERPPPVDMTAFPCWDDAAGSLAACRKDALSCGCMSLVALMYGHMAVLRYPRFYSWIDSGGIEEILQFGDRLAQLVRTAERVADLKHRAVIREWRNVKNVRKQELGGPVLRVFLKQRF